MLKVLADWNTGVAREPESSGSGVSETGPTAAREDEQLRELLVEAGVTLSRSLDIDDTLGVLSKLVVPRFADWYAVHLLDEEGYVAPSRLSHADPARSNIAWEALARWRDRPGSNSAPATVIRTGQAILASNVDTALLARVARNDEHLALLEEAGIRSTMIVPLALDDEIIGAMTFVAAESGRRYGPVDLAVAETLASRAALAIGNARLHQQANEARAAAETSARRLEILLKASEAIAGTLQADDALAELARFATPLLADYCVTYRMDAGGAVARVGLAHADASQQLLVEALVQAGPPSLTDAHGIGEVLRTGTPAVAPNITDAMAAAMAQNPQHAAAVRALAPRSSLLVPLKARGRTIGGAAFVATDRSGRRYGPEDLALAEELAARVALLVDNARLYEEAQATNQAMEDMLSVVAHDLRNPLNSIVTSSILLAADVPPEQRRMAASSIRRAGEQMRRLLDDLLDITRIGQQRLSVHLEVIDLADLIRETTAIYQPVAEARGINLEYHPNIAALHLPADPIRLVQALSNLVDNALKFTPAGGAVRVELDRAEGAARISVCDTGPGIPPEEIPRLFDRFWRAESHSPTGLGLGLCIAKGVVEAHGGRIEVTSTRGCGSRFTVVLSETAATR